MDAADAAFYLFFCGSRIAALYLFSVTTGSRRAVREGRLAAALLAGARPRTNQRPARQPAACWADSRPANQRPAFLIDRWAPPTPGKGGVAYEYSVLIRHAWAVNYLNHTTYGVI
jgi:hypothetical protein